MLFKARASDLCPRQDLLPAVCRESVFPCESCRRVREAGQGRGRGQAKMWAQLWSCLRHLPGHSGLDQHLRAVWPGSNRACLLYSWSPQSLAASCSKWKALLPGTSRHVDLLPWGQLSGGGAAADFWKPACTVPGGRGALVGLETWVGRQQPTLLFAGRFSNLSTRAQILGVC